MLLIVAHHYVVNSGLIQMIQESNDMLNSSVMLVFGAWGKTGINCFVLITGYFMCKSTFSLQKLMKLYLQVIFYGIVIYGIFCVSGHEKFSLFKLTWTLWPVHSVGNGFVDCFLLFFLFIPILNVLVNSMGKKIHTYLVALITAVFTVLPTIPIISMTFNYVTWFMALYMIASYIRIYGLFPNISHKQWGNITICLLMIGCLTILAMVMISKRISSVGFHPYFFISDSNKFLSLAIAVSSFMYFKDLKIKHSRLINAVGGATFGVLLIHANSDTMRTWLWRETVDCTGHFGDSVLLTLAYASISVMIIFVVCAGIEWFRGKFIEPYILDYFNRLTSNLRNKISYRLV